MVNWYFLLEVLRRIGFDTWYVHTIAQVVLGGQTAISINCEIGPYFRNMSGLHEGDPLSPLLFNFVGESSVNYPINSKHSGTYTRVVPHLILGGPRTFNH